MNYRFIFEMFLLFIVVGLLLFPSPTHSTVENSTITYYDQNTKELYYLEGGERVNIPNVPYTDRVVTFNEKVRIVYEEQNISDASLTLINRTHPNEKMSLGSRLGLVVFDNSIGLTVVNVTSPDPDGDCCDIEFAYIDGSTGNDISLMEINKNGFVSQGRNPLPSTVLLNQMIGSNDVVAWELRRMGSNELMQISSRNGITMDGDNSLIIGTKTQYPTGIMVNGQIVALFKDNIRSEGSLKLPLCVQGDYIVRC